MFLLKLLLSVFFWSYIQVSAIMVWLISFPTLLLFGCQKKFIYFVIKVLANILFTLCFIRVKVQGSEKIVRGQRVIYAATRPRGIDPLYLIAYFPVRLRFMAQASLFKIPLVGRVMRTIGCIPAPEKAEDYLVTGKEIIAALKQNEAVMVFGQTDPERLARICDADLVPLLLEGSADVLPRGSLLITPARLTIKI